MDESKEKSIGGSAAFWITKRVADLFVSFALLPLGCFACLILLILNPFLNPGSLFFSQTRVGKRGQLFNIYKFRTMIGDAAEYKFAVDETNRITPFGRFMRQFRIDELPQALNVLKGEMSFIGPRPEQPNFVEQYRVQIKSYDHRHLIRPGITGLAQVEMGYTYDEHGTKGKLKYDLQYLKKSGFRMEFYIIWETLITIFTGFGAK
ncbi:sugar transferase [Cognatiyoonia sp.]|uniref:sugar transferase n=1 Tax=Cognatiyoonia sp. TaxID=2211652 RepID=UPI003F69767B